MCYDVLSITLPGYYANWGKPEQAPHWVVIDGHLIVQMIENLLKMWKICGENLKSLLSQNSFLHLYAMSNNVPVAEMKTS